MGQILGTGGAKEGAMTGGTVTRHGGVAMTTVRRRDGVHTLKRGDATPITGDIIQKTGEVTVETEGGTVKIGDAIQPGGMTTRVTMAGEVTAGRHPTRTIDDHRSRVRSRGREEKSTRKKI